MTTSGPAILYEVSGGQARITLSNAARHNAMTLGMWQDLPKAVARAVADDAVRIIVVAGAGEKAFCAGADISEFGETRSTEEQIGIYNEAVEQANVVLAGASKPTIALIRGICFGGGFGLAMSCDLRLATDDSRFRIPAARLGLGYDYSGIESLVRKIGMAGVAELLLSARIFDSADAQRYQILHRLWPRADFEAGAEGYLGDMASNAPLTLQAVKRALIEISRPEAEREPAAADALVAKCFASLDYKEGQRAFLEKRPPVFRGI
ncbi:MAG: enoyl-CoA hydratase [Beijerinckiaceae bacterium]|jgi:enoyl-CoA hydratase/carnithine racemase|nr:enoyl-CoA hydratase [Beijerinckiaceae bacterium]